MLHGNSIEAVNFRCSISHGLGEFLASQNHSVNMTRRTDFTGSDYIVPQPEGKSLGELRKSIVDKHRPNILPSNYSSSSSHSSSNSFYHHHHNHNYHHGGIIPSLVVPSSRNVESNSPMISSSSYSIADLQFHQEYSPPAAVKQSFPIQNETIFDI
jgi:hypothetical protein